MATTPNMFLILPVPTVTLGPQWASELNSALTLVDGHDHTTGKGRQITTAALNINSDLSINSFNLNLVKSTRYTSNASVLAGPNDLRSTYVVNGDLYYNNSGGTPVQITSGAAVTAISDGISRAYQYIEVDSTPYTITPVSQSSYVAVDSSGSAITINLPAANSVAAGRFFQIKDESGDAGVNNITVVPAGSDEINGDASSFVIEVEFQSVEFTSNGLNGWSTNKVIPEANSIGTPQLIDLSVTEDKLDALSVSETKMQDDSVPERSIIDGAVSLDKLAAESVDASKLLLTSEIPGAAVFNLKLQRVFDPLTFTMRTASQANSWNDVAYGAGLFVAVAGDGTNRVMTSPDGITWTNRTASSAQDWRSITFIDDTFIAVAYNTSTTMVSTDGINWSAGGALTSGYPEWTKVVHGNGIAMALAYVSVRISSNKGASWTSSTPATADRAWSGAAYGNSIWVAVSPSNGTTNLAMSSTNNGSSWTARTMPEACEWQDVAFGNGIFVAVSQNGTNRVATSTDGITWTARSAATVSAWKHVTYANGLFVATAGSGTSRFMSSSDGITWTASTISGLAGTVTGITSDNSNKFVAVASSGTNRAAECVRTFTDSLFIQE